VTASRSRVKAHDLPFHIGLPSGYVEGVAHDDCSRGHVNPTPSQVTEVRALVAAESFTSDDGPAMIGTLQRLCRAARRDLPASGVGVSLVSEDGSLLTAAASSAASVVVEELQFTLGEGPCLAAFSSRQPVLVPDLSEAVSRWPGYGPSAYARGVRAVFAFPLQTGRTRLGALDVYRDQPGELSEWTLARAEVYAEVARDTMVEVRAAPNETVSVLVGGDESRLEVYQAQGMVMAQLGIDANEALARMRAHAYANDLGLRDVADDIIARRLTLEADDA